MNNTIDIQTLNQFAKFLNLRQVCSFSEVNYNSVKGKVLRFKNGKKAKLNPVESAKLAKGIKNLADTFSKLN